MNSDSVVWDGIVWRMAQYSRVAEHLFIRKKTGRYYAIVKKNRQTLRHSLKTKIREVANTRLFDFLLEVGVAPIQVNRHRDIPTFAQAAAQLVDGQQKLMKGGKLAEKTFEGIQGHLKKASEKLGHLRMSQIRPHHVKGYLDERHMKNSGRTTQIDATHVRRLFAFAKDRGWAWIDPTAHLPAYPTGHKRVHVPKTEEIKAVLAFLRGNECVTKEDGKKAADFIEFLCLSGLRCQGAQTIRWEDIDFERGHLTVTEKGNKTREVDLFPGLRTWLEARRQPSGLLFPNTHKGNGSKLFCPKKSLIKACKLTEAQRFTFHACRHFFATQCLEAGISASTVAGCCIRHSFAQSTGSRFRNTSREKIIKK